MAGNGKKWFVGCGIGCGLVLLILGAMGTCAYVGIRDIKEEADSYESASDDLVAEFGDAQDYIPPADGTIASDRIDTFLNVRLELYDTRTQIADIFGTLDDDDGDKASTIAKIKAGMKMVPALIKFGGERNQVLYNNRMGLGEYQYIYSLAYFSMLDMDISDGPPFNLSDNNNDGDGAFNWSAGGSSGGKQDHEQMVRETMHDLLLRLLKNQIRALGEPTANETAELTAWRNLLDTELDTMRDESRRLLWEEGLPAQTAASLEPYREELELSYEPLVNVLEIGIDTE